MCCMNLTPVNVHSGQLTTWSERTSSGSSTVSLTVATPVLDNPPQQRLASLLADGHDYLA